MYTYCHFCFQFHYRLKNFISELWECSQPIPFMGTNNLCHVILEVEGEDLVEFEKICILLMIFIPLLV